MSLFCGIKRMNNIQNIDKRIFQLRPMLKAFYGLYQLCAVLG
jgi:hypothetical protein